MIDSVFIIVALIFLFASTIRSAFGFGDALIAMPLLALLINVKEASPLVAMMGFTISLLIIVKNWKAAYTEGLWVIVLFCLLGIPFGIYFLKNSNEQIIKIFLAVMIMSFSAMNLLKLQKLKLKTEKLSWLFGLVSGALGGAYNTNGPPIIIYGRLRGWDAVKFRAILQTVFLPTNLLIIVGQGAAGLWTSDILIMFIKVLPLIVLGTVIGGYINRKTSSAQFTNAVDVLLLIIGIILILNTLI